MERYIQRNWVKNIKNKGASAEDYVKKDHDNRPARFVQMISGYIGAILALMGLTIILDSNLGDSSGGRKILALLPLIFGGGAYMFHKLKHPNNEILRELTSAFLYITFTKTLFDSVGAFGVEMDPGDGKYLTYLSFVIGLAIIYLNKSSLTVFVFLFYLIAWGGSMFMGMLMFGGMASSFGITSAGLGSAEGIALFWIFLGALYVIYFKDFKAGESNFKTVLLGWLLALAVTSGAVTSTGGYTLLGLSAVSFALYVFGKKYFDSGSAFWSRPFQTTSLLIASILMIAGSKKGSVTSLFGPSDLELDNIVGLVISLAILGGTAYYYYENHWKTENKLNIFMLGVPGLAIVALLFNFIKEGIDLVAILYTLGAGALFVKFILDGVKSKYPPIVLTGLVMMIMLIFFKFIAPGEDPNIKGGAILASGLALLYLVLHIDREWGLGNLKDVIKNNDNIIDK